MLDDGPAGLMAIKRCGGVTVVQDPRDAAYSGMPVNALNNVDVDFCVAIAEIGPLLTTLVSQLHRKSKDRNEHRRRANETQGYIDRIRGMLLVPGSDAPPDTLTDVKALMAEPRQAKSTR